MTRQQMFGGLVGVMCALAVTLLFSLRPPSNGVRKIQPEPVPSGSSAPRPCADMPTTSREWVESVEASYEFARDCHVKNLPINCWDDGLCDCADWDELRRQAKGEN